MAAQAPLSARENRTLRAAGSTQVTSLTPRTGKNPLLQRDDIGRARPTCYDLPDEKFAYGRPGNLDREGAREVSMFWVSHTPSKSPQEGAPDFMSYNKKAIEQNAVTAKDQMVFRRDNGILPEGGRGFQQAKVPYHSMFTKDPVPSDLVPGFTYGRKVRPSTPIRDVISGSFGARAEEALGRYYEGFREDQERAASTHRIPLTAAARGHASARKGTAPHEERHVELFKMGKFKRATPKIDTRWRRPTPESGDNLSAIGVEVIKSADADLDQEDAESSPVHGYM